MARKKVGPTRKQFTSTMLEELYLVLQEESERTGVPISKLLDKAVEEYLKSHELIPRG